MEHDILRYDDWDDVFNYREYIELASLRSRSTKSEDNNNGCGCLIFWIIIALATYWWVIIQNI